MLLRCVPLFLALLALCAFTVEARPMKGTLLSRRLTVEERSLTNAQRLKRGLPPRSPIIGRVLPGREELGPTPASKAKRGSPSPSPAAQVYTGHLEIRLANGTFVGMVNNSANGFPNVDIGGTAGTDIEVKIATTRTGGPFSLLATNPVFTGSPFIGGGTNATLGSNSSTIVPLANVPQTSAGIPPTPKGASALWTVDAKTLQLTSKWTNLDGSSITAILLWHKESNLIFLTGDAGNIDDINNPQVGLFLVK
ncbi:uncharacterized protein PHACADRAFT_263754 [Phanerochaete carnosa HHB-10118-sp]|uniref:DOMON domain-containing protein n=1 Tax=Phanerochaete carnosa (strain HHB-10118-sp) TaxID=650164 RepID=K5WJM6_PHACS|nr:uncharacterized protein PHACADRAFT_263754 [Phanerochaete carnosa HHB-10118-sp]EKM50452.1 hypothetical protein PHACADRAFT_263754 [Phanerochaete carnosa HHB-10118-sp]